MSARIHFVCPSCGAQHDRGFLDGVCVFRCFGCGYQGHGFHPDPEIDRQVFADHQAANAVSRFTRSSGDTARRRSAEPWALTGQAWIELTDLGLVERTHGYRTTVEGRKVLKQLEK